MFIIITASPNMNSSLIADLVVAVHFAYVTIVVCGLVVILLGRFFHWRFVRNFWLRAIHIIMIVIVAIEALLGITCPMTDLEYELRIAAGQQGVSNTSFIARFIHKIIFYEFPPIVFTIAYCLFGLAL